jgi:hypothetical protein
MNHGKRGKCISKLVIFHDFTDYQINVEIFRNWGNMNNKISKDKKVLMPPKVKLDRDKFS